MPPAASSPILRVFRRPRFVDDLTEAYAYLAERNAVTADRLLDEVELVIQLLSAFPEIGRPREELRPGVRSFRLRRFRHVLFYRLDQDRVVLLRLLHGARDVQPDLIESQP
jgi:toxin ParE1/3/4